MRQPFKSNPGRTGPQTGRQRSPDALYYQLIANLDEGTAIIVRKSEAEIVGKGHAHLYDRRRPVYPDRPDFLALPGGSAFDLAERKVVRDVSR